MIQYDKKAAARLAQECGADDFAVLLLLSRGIDSVQKIQDFLSFDAETLSSPFLLRDMDRAVQRIQDAINSDERILIYGDYDADGVTATALLFSYLESVGANVDYYIPSRAQDGYGLSNKTAEKIIEGGFDLVVTVDNGIAALSEAQLLKDNGIDLVVTDHHKPGAVLPEAVAVVNPHREDDSSPEKELAGVGVALKLAAALEDGDYSLILENFGDLAAIGTVADVVPLIGENRVIAALGLRSIENSRRIGLEALIERAGMADKEISSASIAYGIAPRINAAGRMGTADIALELLLTEDAGRAAQLSEEIEAANTARQETEAEITREAESYFDEKPSRRLDRVLVAAGHGWHPGVIGIVAARLVEKYGRPAVVISVQEDGTARASGRSIEGFSLYDALLASSDTLLQFGGHTLAAGFSLTAQNIEPFRQKINEYAAGQGDIFPKLSIDCRLNPARLSTDILDSLSLLEPFGAKNPPPVFGLTDMTVTAIKPVGDNRHIRLTLSKKHSAISAVMFGQPASSFPFAVGDTVDIAVRLSKNEYRGEVKLNLQIKDIRPSRFSDRMYFGSVAEYLSFRRGEYTDSGAKQRLCPDRELISAVYRAVKERNGQKFYEDVFCMKNGIELTRAGAVLTALDALEDMGLIEKSGEEYELSEFSGKTNLADCGLLKSLGYK